MAPSIAAIIISQRAVRSPPSRKARSIWPAQRTRPSCAIASAGGLTAGARNVSMQWAMASMPVPAVRAGGRPRVSSGSHRAHLGIRCGLRRASLRPSSSTITVPRPTSLPVPAVVGMAISGATRELMRAAPPSTAAYRASSPGWVAIRPTALARSIADPPPRPIRPSQPALTKSSVAARAARSVGLAGRVIEQGRRDRARQPVPDAVQETRGGDALVRHQQRPADAQAPELLAQPADGTEVEMDGGEIGDRRHRPPPLPAPCQGGGR